MKFSWITPPKKPIIVGHRGASSTSPENTLTAFRQAIAFGADAIELDIHLTNDNKIVVIHDEKLNRTTNGSGLVRNHLLSDIKELDAGGWFDKRFREERIPTLEEVLIELKNNVGINIEIKAESMRKQNMMIVDKCIELVESCNLSESILVSSFHVPFIERLKELNKTIPVGILIAGIRKRMKSLVETTKSGGADYLILSGSIVNKHIVKSAHENNLLVGEYTINTNRRFERASHLSIDAIITNSPEKIKELQTTKNKPPDWGLGISFKRD